jgi:hypothetical protein
MRTTSTHPRANEHPLLRLWSVVQDRERLARASTMPKTLQLNTVDEFTPQQVEQSLHADAEQIKRLREYLAAQQTSNG